MVINPPILPTYLSHPDDVPIGILDGHAQQSLRSIPRQSIDIVVKPVILQ